MRGRNESEGEEKEKWPWFWPNVWISGVVAEVSVRLGLKELLVLESQGQKRHLDLTPPLFFWGRLDQPAACFVRHLFDTQWHVHIQLSRSLVQGRLMWSRLGVAGELFTRWDRNSGVLLQTCRRNRHENAMLTGLHLLPVTSFAVQLGPTHLGAPSTSSWTSCHHRRCHERWDGALIWHEKRNTSQYLWGVFVLVGCTCFVCVFLIWLAVSCIVSFGNGTLGWLFYFDRAAAELTMCSV